MGYEDSVDKINMIHTILYQPWYMYYQLWTRTLDNSNFSLKCEEAFYYVIDQKFLEAEGEEFI